MAYTFSKDDILNISRFLDAEAKDFGNAFTWQMSNKKTQQSMVINLHNDVSLGGDTTGSMISVQTQHGYHELHDCTFYIEFEPDEIIFVNADDDFVSCLIVGKQCSCSSFSKIRKEIINADFAKLDPAVLLAAMQLSITEAKLQ
jgi:hypothetical protein